MKTLNEELVPLLEAALEESLRVFESHNEQESSLSDLYLYFDKENAVLIIYDDVENKLSEVNLEKEETKDSENFEQQLRAATKSVLSRFEQNSFFEKEFIYKPFAVSMVDEDFIVSEELIFVDDNTLKLDGSLLSGLDKELDEFLKNLMQ